MKHFSCFDNIFETETWYFWGNMKVLLGHLDWGLGTKGPHIDPADKTFLCLHIVSNVSKWSNLFVKNGVKTSAVGSCTIIVMRHLHNFIIKELYMRAIIGYSGRDCVFIILFQLWGSKTGLFQVNLFWMDKYDSIHPTFILEEALIQY